MRGFMMALLVAVAAAALAVPARADETVVPQRRLVLSNDIDFPGGDIGKIFDTTVEACERACLSDSSCHAFTFNLHAGACFPKQSVTGTTPFAGALSGRVIETPPAVLARATVRRGELKFLRDSDFAAALKQATGLADRLVTGEWTAEQLLGAARTSEQSGNFDDAARYVGAALSLTDAPDQWVDYGRLLLQAQHQSTKIPQTEYRSRALAAGVNGYLRADGAPVRATALVIMARALEQLEPRPRHDRAAQPRPAVAAARRHRRDAGQGDRKIRLSHQRARGPERQRRSAHLRRLQPPAGAGGHRLCALRATARARPVGRGRGQPALRCRA